MGKQSSIVFVGLILVRRNGSPERYKVVHVTRTPRSCLVYVAKETASKGWHDHSMLVDDLWGEFDVAAGDEDLDI